MTKTKLAATGILLVLSLLSGNSAFAEANAKEDPMAAAQSFLASPTNKAASSAVTAGEPIGKVSTIENRQLKAARPT